MNSLKPETDVLSQLSNVLPTGTFLVFQSLAPLTTNNGQCHHIHRVLTSIALGIFGVLCVASSFSDSYVGIDGKVHYGIVTPLGIWNRNVPHGVRADNHTSFTRGDLNRYVLNWRDFVTAAISLVALATFTLLTSPVTTCFFPHISHSILQVVPILVGLVLAAVCALGPTPRNGLGFAATPPTRVPAPEPAPAPAPGP